MFHFAFFTLQMDFYRPPVKSSLQVKLPYSPNPRLCPRPPPGPTLLLLYTFFLGLTLTTNLQVHVLPFRSPLFSKLTLASSKKQNHWTSNQGMNADLSTEPCSSKAMWEPGQLFWSFGLADVCDGLRPRIRQLGISEPWVKGGWKPSLNGEAGWRGDGNGLD